MNILTKLLSILFFTGIFFSTQTTEAQFLKKLKKRAEKAAEEAVIRKTEKKVYDETSKKMDTILGNDGGKNQKKTSPNNNPTNPDVNGSSTNTPKSSQDSGKSMEINSKFDFVPGDKLLFYDDFSQDYVGDFPSKWNTNGGGELVTINNLQNKWLKILPGYNSLYIPDLSNLPEEFTLEFDVISNGIDKKTSSQAYFRIMIADNNTFDNPKNYAFVEYSFCQYIARGIIVDNRLNSKRTIRNDIKADIRDVVLNKHHISIAVNKQRFRMWINQKKYVDVPRLLPENMKAQSIKFGLRGIDINKESIFLSNFKIAEGGVDLRRELIEKGKFSTNGILFNSGSAIIQPQSYGIIKQISQALQQEPSMHINIIGYTDADGSDQANLTLSKQRADAVKKALVVTYNIPENRLQTDGKGETMPVGDNNTAEGKAQNRRVEFVKL